MKVLLVNGSPHRNGCTAAALAEVASALRDEAVASDFFWIGTEPLGGCVACFQCRRKGKCVLDDKVNEFVELAAGFDGFVFGFRIGRRRQLAECSESEVRKETVRCAVQYRMAN